MLNMWSCTLNPLKTSLNRLCFRTEQALRREEIKDEVLEGRFRNLNYSTSTKKTTEYSFEIFLSIYRY